MAGLAPEERHRERSVTAAPMIAPVVPLTPLGRSTATIGTPEAFIASIIARGSPPTSRSRPAPNNASTTASQFDRDAGEAFFDRAAPAICRLRRVALQFRAIADEAETHLVAALGEVAGGDKSVTTVIARAGHDDDARQLASGRSHRPRPARRFP